MVVSGEYFEMAVEIEGFKFWAQLYTGVIVIARQKN